MAYKPDNIFLRLITKYGIYFVLAIAFVPALITVVTKAYGPVENFGLNILYYHVGYETGFGGRKLLASFCHLIFPDFVKLRHIRTMVLAVNFIMVALFIIFVGKSFKNNKNDASLLPVLLIYAVGPFSLIAFMTSGLSVAFAETYQISWTLLWLLLWIKYRGRWPFYLATLFIAVICCLHHHTFCCELFPLYVGLFAYDIVEYNGLNIKNTIGYGIVCTVLLVLLVVIWRFSQMTIDIDQLNEWFKTHAAVDAYECSREAQTGYYYMTNDENRASMASYFTWNHRYGEFVVSIILMSPLLFTIYYPWIRASHSAPSRLLSWRYRLTWILITIITLPIFFMATDYNRWFICFFFSMFAATIAVVALGDTTFTNAIRKMSISFIKHPYCAFVLAIYVIGLHCTPFGAEYSLREALHLWNFIQDINF